MEVFCGNFVLLDENSSIQPAAILVENGKIIKVIPGSKEIPEVFKEKVIKVTDASDYILMPGLIDSHVHVNEPGRTEWEGFETATKAAAASGITCIVDMPLNSIPPTTTVSNFETKIEVAEKKAFIDVAFWGGVVPRNRDQLRPLLAKGVKGFKCFLMESGVQEFPCVTIDQAHDALIELKGTNAVLLFHAELDIPPINRTRASDDLNKYQTFLTSRPAQMEDNAIKEVIKLCRSTKVRCHIVHLGSGNSVRILEEAQKEGLPITAETCHHYLNLNSDEIPDAAAEFKCCPPVRDGWHREKLWDAVKKGVCSLVVSDHAPCTADLKTLTSKVTLMSAWGGISSLQFCLPLMWTEASRRGFTIQDVLRLCSVGPAKLASLDDRKSRIKEGFDADFVIFDPEATFTVTKESILYKNKLSPYMNRTLSGVVKKTFVRGQIVYDGGVIVTKEPVGKLLL